MNSDSTTNRFLTPCLLNWTSGQLLLRLWQHKAFRSQHRWSVWFQKRVLDLSALALFPQRLLSGAKEKVALLSQVSLPPSRRTRFFASSNWNWSYAQPLGLLTILDLLHFTHDSAQTLLVLWRKPALESNILEAFPTAPPDSLKFQRTPLAKSHFCASTCSTGACNCFEKDWLKSSLVSAKLWLQHAITFMALRPAAIVAIVYDFFHRTHTQT